MALWHVLVFGFSSLKCGFNFRRGHVGFLMDSSSRQYLTSEFRIEFQDSSLQCQVDSWHTSMFYLSASHHHRDKSSILG